MDTEDNQIVFEAPEVAEVAALFSNYEIYSLIAQGGMGAVYHAFQTSLEREVAIKILPRALSQDKNFRDSFTSEAKAMAKLNHTNLIAVYDFGEVDGMLFLVMEYVPGKSLYEATHGCTLEQVEALHLATAICRGLEHAHAHGILHRDIKPANILLDNQANPKVGDFGLARPMTKKVEEGEGIFGTPGYTAPEVIDPPHDYDQRADVFSMGVVLYELLAGSLPPEGGGKDKIADDVEAPVIAIVEKALEEDPNDRFADCGEFVSAMEEVIRTSATRARGDGAAKKKSYLLPILGVIVFFAVAIGYLAFSGSENELKSATVEPVVTPKAKAENTPDFDVAGESFLPVDAAYCLTQAKLSLQPQLKEELATCEEELAKNTQALVAGMKVIAAGSGEEIEALVQEWGEDRDAISETLPTDLVLTAGIPELHRKYLDKQILIDENYAEITKKYAPFYISELESYIERFADYEDKTELELLHVEIEKVRADPGYLKQVLAE